jgi:hypothetical protein
VREAGGNWKGRYGSLGAVIFGEDDTVSAKRAASIPLEPGTSSAQLTFWDCVPITLRPEGRPPEKAPLRADGRGRVLGAINSTSAVKMRLKFPDEKVRCMTLYVCDWRDAGRVEMISISDSNNNRVLASKAVSNFNEGLHFMFAVSGDITITIERAKGPNAVVSAIFLDPVPVK